MSSKQLFIIGNPRSGTSLLRIILHSHSKISIPEECHFFLWLEAKYGNWSNNLKADFLIDLYASRKFETWDINKSKFEKEVYKTDFKSYSSLVSFIYDFYAIHRGKKTIEYWGDKNKLWRDKLWKITDYFPNSKSIHLVRDGRDVACSFIDLHKKKSLDWDSIYYPNLPSNISEIAERWNLNILKINEFLSRQKKSSFLEIRYEDLVMNTKETLINILTFLGLDFEEGCLKYHENEFSNIEPIEYIKWKSKLTQKPDMSNVYKYKKLLNSSEITSFNLVAKESLKKYNYEL